MLWRRFTCLVGQMVLLLAAQPAAPGGPAVAAAAPRQDTACDQGPTNPATHQAGDLDQFAADWGVFCEPSLGDGGFPTWQKYDITAPSLDGHALQCALTGGSSYANVHCYRNLLPDPATVGVTLTLAFQFWPAPPCTDLQTACVQALEFSVSKWHSQLRYEWAVQWEHIGDVCPQWRYWDPFKPGQWVTFDPPLLQKLQAGRWYELLLVGEIRRGQTHYVHFDIHEPAAPSQLYFFGELVAAPRPDQSPDRLAVAVQLDGNILQQPYNVALDQVALQRSTTSLAVVLQPRAYLPLVSAGAQAPPPGC